MVRIEFNRFGNDTDHGLVRKVDKEFKFVGIARGADGNISVNALVAEFISGVDNIIGID